MSLLKYLVAVISCVWYLPGCAVTGQSNEVIYIDYKLPELEFEIKATYQLRKCNREAFVVKIGADVSPKFNTLETPTFRFNPSIVSRKGSRVAQNITVELHPNATIKSINAVSEDKTGSIISNVFKFATGLLKATFGLAAEAVTPDLCKATIVHHLQSADRLVERIKKLDDDLTKLLIADDPSDALNKQIAAYGKSIAALKTQLTELRINHLTIEKTDRIKAADLERSNFVSLTENDLKKWLVPDREIDPKSDPKSDQGSDLISKSLEQLKMIAKESWEENKWGKKPASLTRLLFSIELRLSASGSVKTVDASYAGVHDKLFIRRPVVSAFEVCAYVCQNDDNSSSQTKRLATGTVVIPQWGTVQKIDFAVKAFEKRTLVMSFDEAGNVTKLTWNVPSKSDNVFRALAGASEQAVTFLETVEYGKDLAEIKALEIQTNLLLKRVALEEAKDKYDKAFSTDDISE